MVRQGGEQEGQGKRSILYANSNLTYIQLGQLQKNIGELVQQNRKKYCKIAEQKPGFAYQLYKTGEFQANSRAFGKELLLRQLDRLLEEKNYLDRELSLIRLESEEQSEQKQRMMSDEANHFELLKSIWKRDRSSKYEGAIEHAEDLNLMVAQIKSNIHSLIKFEANQHKEFEQTYLETFQILHERNKQCKKCGQYKAKVEGLLGKLEGLEEKASRLSDQNISYLQEINKREEKLKRAGKLQLKQEAELKDRLIRLEQDLLKRDQAIKLLRKQLAEYDATRFVNRSEGFELIFRGPPFELPQPPREIEVTAQSLLAFLAQPQAVQSAKVSTQEIKRYSVVSKCDSTEGSAQSNKDITGEESTHTIVVSRLSQNIHVAAEKLGVPGAEKRKGGETSEVKSRGEELEGGCKRYVRTGSKRNIRSTSNLFNEENEGGVSVRARGASPSYLVNLQ